MHNWGTSNEGYTLSGSEMNENGGGVVSMKRHLGGKIIVLNTNSKIWVASSQERFLYIKMTYLQMGKFYTVLLS